MTTIVYDNNKKQIACDSRQTADGFIQKDDAIKYRRRGGVIWFLCGDIGDVDIFIDDFEHNKEAIKNLCCSAMYVKDKVAHVACVERGVYKTSVMDYTDGSGSGGWLALVAVELGKSAKDAVEYAKTKDANSGGKVHVFDIEANEFLK